MHLPGETANLAGTFTWVEMPRDDVAFLDFLGQVVAVLAQPAPPDPVPDCPWCEYRAASRRHGL